MQRFLYPYTKQWSEVISSFFRYGKKLPYVVTRHVRPSSVEISLERCCTITNKLIGLKFGLNIGGRVIHV